MSNLSRRSVLLFDNVGGGGEYSRKTLISKASFTEMPFEKQGKIEDETGSRPSVPPD